LVQAALSLGVELPGFEADHHSHPSSSEVKNAWSYFSTPPMHLHGVATLHFYLHNEELHFSFESPNIVRIVKSMRLRNNRHVAKMGRQTDAEFWWEDVYLKDCGRDWMIILI
jgi:hypothetical protein